MSDIAEILEQYDYAETITKTLANGKLTVTVAEASNKRNRAFGQAMFHVMMRDDVNRLTDVTEDIEIDVLCGTLLKRWDLTKNGKPVPISEARSVFKSGRAGSLLFREIGEITATPSNFLNQPSKKKTSSKSTTRKRPSKARPKRSPAKRKPAAAKSPPGSNGISKEQETPG
ncbi:MAG: hypothetical protein ACR2RE_09530 [Geminicoccaceae bacterium]